MNYHDAQSISEENDSKISRLQSDLAAERKRIIGYQQERHEVEQALGRALGYTSGPDGTEICVGDHSPASLAGEVVAMLTAERKRREEAEATYASTKAGIDHIEGRAESAEKLYLEMKDYIADVQADNTRLREALEFYADKKNWMQTERGVHCFAHDHGDFARAALNHEPVKEHVWMHQGLRVAEDEYTLPDQCAVCGCQRGPMAPKSCPGGPGKEGGK